MDALELLRTRHSAARLSEPAPCAEAIEAMLESAGRAPDHGRLQPWRLILFEGDARVGLGEILAAGLSRRNPLAESESLRRERDRALRAPLVIVVATRCDRSARIPVIEQMVSAGAAAHSLMPAAFALGCGATWPTGDAAYDETVKHALGIGRDDVIVGFIYVGTEVGGAPSRPRRTGAVRRVLASADAGRAGGLGRSGHEVPAVWRGEPRGPPAECPGAGTRS
jgi:nitroreductase